jgi:hypothetical protein
MCGVCRQYVGCRVKRTACGRREWLKWAEVKCGRDVGLPGVTRFVAADLRAAADIT